MIVDIILNAACTGLGAGIGSYFGAKIAQKSEAHFKDAFRVRKDDK